MDDMDMTTGTTTTTMSSMGLGFHITPFDQLWFEDWAPQTNGAFVGACLGLFVLALVERWVSAIRALCELRWRRRTDAVLTESRRAPVPDSRRSSVLLTPGDEKHAFSEASTSVEDFFLSKTSPPAPSATYRPVLRLFPTRLSAIARNVPPFVWSNDLPRGLLQIIQAALAYVLMLAFMDYNWGYCLAILAGLGVGEILFGRFGSGGGGGHHSTY